MSELGGAYAKPNSDAERVALLVEKVSLRARKKFRNRQIPC
jgi:hypothetical protein